MNTDSQWSKQEACSARATRVRLVVNHNTNTFNVLSVLHGQGSLAAVNQICIIHEAMSGCKILKNH